MKEARDLLASARDLLDDPDHFYTEWFAVDDTGRWCDGGDTGAVAWCALGALQAFVTDYPENVQSEAIKRLSFAAGKMVEDTDRLLAITIVNDSLGHAATLQMFDAAIKSLENA